MPYLSAQVFGGNDNAAEISWKRPFLGTEIYQIYEGEPRFFMNRGGRGVRYCHAHHQEIYLLPTWAAAPKLAEELAQAYVPWETKDALEELDNTPFDAAYYLRPNNVQHFVAALEGKVLYFRTEAPEDIREHYDEIYRVMNVYERGVYGE